MTDTLTKRHLQSLASDIERTGLAPVLYDIWHKAPGGPMAKDRETARWFAERTGKKSTRVQAFVKWRHAQGWSTKADMTNKGEFEPPSVEAICQAIREIHGNDSFAFRQKFTAYCLRLIEVPLADVADIVGGDTNDVEKLFNAVREGEPDKTTIAAAIFKRARCIDKEEPT